MNDHQGEIHRDEAALTSANFQLAAEFLQEAFDNPALLDAIPNGVSVILVPRDHPELARANLAIVEAAIARGEDVRIRIVGGTMPEHERWRAVDRRDFAAQSVSPRWSSGADPADLTVVYDQAHDVLLVDFLGGRVQGAAVPRGVSTYLLVDLERQEAFGYLIPQFLERAVRKVPGLARILAAAELRPLTAGELGGLDVAEAGMGGQRGEQPPAVETEDDLDQWLKDLELLTA